MPKTKTSKPVRKRTRAKTHVVHQKIERTNPLKNMKLKFKGKFEKGKPFIIYADGTVKQAQTKKPTKEQLREEKALFKDPYGLLSQEDYNPDTISISTYKKMTKDAQVAAGLDLISFSTLSKSWYITHPDKDVSEWVTKVLKNLKEPTLYQAFLEILDALPFGFSCFEVVYAYDEDEQKVILRRKRGIKCLDPEYIDIYTSKVGEITQIMQTISTPEVELDLERTYLYSYAMKYGNRYGTSLLKSCYKNWFIKDRMLKFANIAYETHGAPIFLGTVADPNDIDMMETTLKGLRAVGTAVVSEGMNIESLESKGWRGTVMPFVDYVKYHDEMIFRRMIIGSLVLSKDQAGAYSLSKTHFDAFVMRIESLRKDLGAVFEGVINQMIRFNFDTDEPAQLEFQPFTEKNLEALANVFNLMLQGGVITPDEAWIREMLTFPPAEKIEKQAPPKDKPDIEEEEEKDREEEKQEAKFQLASNEQILKPWNVEVNRIMNEVRMLRDKNVLRDDIKEAALKRARSFVALIVGTLQQQTLTELSQSLGKPVKALPPEAQRRLAGKTTTMLKDFEAILDDELNREPREAVNI